MEPKFFCTRVQTLPLLQAPTLRFERNMNVQVLPHIGEEEGHKSRQPRREKFIFNLSLLI